MIRTRAQWARRHAEIAAWARALAALCMLLVLAAYVAAMLGWIAQATFLRTVTAVIITLAALLVVALAALLVTLTVAARAALRKRRR